MASPELPVKLLIGAVGRPARDAVAMFQLLMIRQVGQQEVCNE